MSIHLIKIGALKVEQIGKALNQHFLKIDLYCGTLLSIKVVLKAYQTVLEYSAKLNIHSNESEIKLEWREE